MDLIWDPRAAKEWARLPRDKRDRIKETLEEIARDPFRPYAGVKPMKGAHGLYRCRAGDWRAVYHIHGGQMRVIKVGHRQGVYR